MPKVFINPGHQCKYNEDGYMMDSGAVNYDFDITEAEVALEIGELVKGYLEAVGYEVDLLQSDNLCWDSDYSDEPCIVDYAMKGDFDIAVSIHCNAFNGVANGTETLVYGFDEDNSVALANCIQDQIINSIDTSDRGIKARPGLAFLNYIEIPVVLVETAFIDNYDDAVILINQKDDIARAIARGITDYFSQL